MKQKLSKTDGCDTDRYMKLVRRRADRKI